MTSLGHALLGVVFLLKGVAKADHWPEHAGFVVLFAGAGLVVFLGTALHRRLEPRFPHMEALFFLLEGIVLAAMTWLYFEAGKRWLPWVTGATAVALAVLAVYRAWRPPAHRNA
jgi:FtsH-binding integral membrane protein